jgi:hypothetical protein
MDGEALRVEVNDHEEKIELFERARVTRDQDEVRGDYIFVDQLTHDMRLAWYTDEYRRTADGWRIHRRSTTFMRRSGGFDSGNPHDPARFVAGREIEQ